VRDRAVRWIAFCIKHWPTVKRQLIRLASLVGGLLILKREIYDVEHPEPLLIFPGTVAMRDSSSAVLRWTEEVGPGGEGVLGPGCGLCPELHWPHCHLPDFAGTAEARTQVGGYATGERRGVRLEDNRVLVMWTILCIVGGIIASLAFGGVLVSYYWRVGA
jgi:hypothetical protein